MKKTIITGLALITITGCGNNSHWGIDGNVTQDVKSLSITDIPRCNIEALDAVEAGAIELSSNSSIKKTEENTELRIWHFENSNKAVCILKGQAIIENTKEL